MAERLFLAVEAPDEQGARDAVERFFDSSLTILSLPSPEFEYEIVEVRSASNGKAEINPAVENDILVQFAAKDMKVSQELSNLLRLQNREAQIVAALAPEEDLDVLKAKMWAEGFITKGKTLSIYHTGWNDEVSWFLDGFADIIQLMGSDFHIKVGFWDVEEYVPSMDGLVNRIKVDPDEQWVVTLEIRQLKNAYVRNITHRKETERLKRVIGNLGDHIRDLCIKYHNAQYEACPECAPLLSDTDNILS